MECFLSGITLLVTLETTSDRLFISSNSSRILVCSGPAIIHRFKAAGFAVKPTAPQEPFTFSLFCSCVFDVYWWPTSVVCAIKCKDKHQQLQLKKSCPSLRKVCCYLETFLERNHAATLQESWQSPDVHAVFWLSGQPSGRIQRFQL